MPAECLDTLDELRAEHSRLLEEWNDEADGGAAEAQFDAVQTLLQRGARAGACLQSSEERREAQNLLNYWRTVLTRAGRDVGPATLDPFQPAARLEHLADRWNAGCPLSLLAEQVLTLGDLSGAAGLSPQARALLDAGAREQRLDRIRSRLRLLGIGLVVVAAATAVCASGWYQAWEKNRNLHAANTRLAEERAELRRVNTDLLVAMDDLKRSEEVLRKQVETVRTLSTGLSELARDPLFQGYAAASPRAGIVVQELTRPKGPVEDITLIQEGKPVLYIHTRRTEPDQQKQAEELKPRLEALGIVVHSIEALEVGPRRTDLRYFNPGDRPMAEALVRSLARLGLPGVVLNRRTHVRGRTSGRFELWFGAGARAPGAIAGETAPDSAHLPESGQGQPERPPEAEQMTHEQRTRPGQGLQPSEGAAGRGAAGR
jgi:hypothetical protein